MARARATLETCETQLGATHEELFETAIHAPTAATLAAAEAHEQAQQRDAENARRAERQQREQHVRVELSLLEARRRASTTQAEKQVAEQRSRPLIERWTRFETEVREKSLSLLSGDHGDLASALAWERAKSDAAMLAERASSARDGQELAELARVLPTVSDDRAAHFLATWVATREWVSRRVPPDVAQVADPLDALAQLGAHLSSLRARLAAQEHELRADAGSIAKHIRGQVRRARHQVQRLNEDLVGVSFGGIDAIRVRLQPVEHKEQVLQALENDAEAQRMLWDPDLSIEQALEHLIRTYGGGRSGGERLLDYRDYVELQVEVRRKAGGAWEIANPNRLSTGEAIGVGAAVMMTVLKAWEEDAQLLRTRRSFGTLRLLFLDEASRLSDDTLRLLFELCDRLELQLLIAAPRVDNAAGNTTYRLVRKVDQHGQETVHVSGRRVLRDLPA
ncbi:MAG: SbcC/MukB-like Walker B domain-containing protein [Myxococcota bacterium]